MLQSFEKCFLFLKLTSIARKWKTRTNFNPIKYFSWSLFCFPNFWETDEQPKQFFMCSLQMDAENIWHVRCVHSIALWWTAYSVFTFTLCAGIMLPSWHYIITAGVRFRLIRFIITIPYMMLKDDNKIMHVFFCLDLLVFVHCFIFHYRPAIAFATNEQERKISFVFE